MRRRFLFASPKLEAIICSPIGWKIFCNARKQRSMGTVMCCSCLDSATAGDHEDPAGTKILFCTSVHGSDDVSSTPKKDRGADRCLQKTPLYEEKIGTPQPWPWPLEERKAHAQPRASPLPPPKPGFWRMFLGNGGGKRSSVDEAVAADAKNARAMGDLDKPARPPTDTLPDHPKPAVGSQASSPPILQKIVSAVELNT